MTRLSGAVAQLGERVNGIHEVVGSIPSGSTSTASPSSSRPRTPPFHGGNRGSNPLGDARFSMTCAALSVGHAVYWCTSGGMRTRLMALVGCW